MRVRDYLKFRDVNLEPPGAVDHLSRVTDWGMYGNDRYNDCGPTAAANMRKMISLYVTGKEASPTQDDVFALYRLQNPAFDPNDPQGPGDQGVDLQTMCENLLSQGIGGVKPLGFASVDVTDLAEVFECVTLFGGILLGVDLTEAQAEQTDAGQAWDYVKGSPLWGKHAILYGAYQHSPSLGWSISWASAIALTQLFEQNQLEEGWVIIWPENLTIGAFQRGVNLDALAADYKALTGRDFPVSEQPVDPTPAPAPEPQADPVNSFVQNVDQLAQQLASQISSQSGTQVSTALAPLRALCNQLDSFLQQFGV